MTEKLPRLLEPEQLAMPIDPLRIRLVDLCPNEQYAAAHIPGAVHVDPMLTTAGAPLPGLVPAPAQLTRLFAELGHHQDIHYVVYDDEGGGWAGRFIWLLDSIGHNNWSYLNGGLHAWHDAGLPLQNGTERVAATSPQLQLNQNFTISVEQLLANLDNPELLVWDARSPAEHTGQRVFASKAGHIPGAVNFEWTAAMDPQRQLRLRSDIAECLQALGITPDRDLVTHCQTHHRSGFTYLIARLLGYPRIRAYAGSWSEWGNHPSTPVEL
ncbi:rhodanese-like domain-containing protein [Halopseudomonas yangmingensis]|uniref:Thiosulfate/3-mercaptopyruvate sulfurtransferase n=1 Tax=Halopseudomonas yangmingensis TaxID=1720063 RepID=A0A1I4PTM9_9GAMM|nr:rhodanese-like domain-containing protein [Halopseudomonas yangmingensis]SFM30725.1 thiosulfate/3-mercaptopyruvate sulfurtransferase [Halopseudomonas yangmingensis]